MTHSGGVRALPANCSAYLHFFFYRLIDWPTGRSGSLWAVRVGGSEEGGGRGSGEAAHCTEVEKEWGEVEKERPVRWPLTAAVYGYGLELVPGAWVVGGPGALQPSTAGAGGEGAGVGDDRREGALYVSAPSDGPVRGRVEHRALRVEYLLTWTLTQAVAGAGLPVLGGLTPRWHLVGRGTGIWFTSGRDGTGMRGQQGAKQQEKPIRTNRSTYCIIGYFLCMYVYNSIVILKNRPVL